MTKEISLRNTTALPLDVMPGLSARRVRPLQAPAIPGSVPAPGRMHCVPPAALHRLGVRARRLLRSDD
jgi:hypothetical protein